jgi:hypothetical protein
MNAARRSGRAALYVQVCTDRRRSRTRKCSCGLQRARKAGKALGRARMDRRSRPQSGDRSKKATVSGRRRGSWASAMGRFKGSRGSSPKAKERAAGSLGDWHVRSYLNRGCAKTRVATPALANHAVQQTPVLRHP